MYASLSTALSALNAQSAAIDVVGNNLANLNTTGYKAGVVTFHDLVAEQTGFGIGRPTTLRQFSQGAIQTTSAPLAAAIQGNGFFVVRDSAGATMYTRDGNLQVDQFGNLITTTGQKVQGWTGTGAALNTNGPIGDIRLPSGTLRAPVASTQFSINGNLNAAGTAGPPATTFVTSVDVYDSLGAGHTVTITFTKTSTPNNWSYAVTCPDGTVTTTPAAGDVTFDSNGVLVSPTAADPQPTIAIAGLSNGAADLNLTWSLFDGTNSRLSQFSQASAVAANAQNGSPAAQLTRLSMANGGAIMAQYSNGEQSVVGQLAMASVMNPEWLNPVGNNNYQLSALNSAPVIGMPGTGQRGVVVGGAVESSTVDIAKEFTNLIVLQRGYQANSKVITTVDDLSQQTINLKRD